MGKRRFTAAVRDEKPLSASRRLLPSSWATQRRTLRWCENGMVKALEKAWNNLISECFNWALVFWLCLAVTDSSLPGVWRRLGRAMLWCGVFCLVRKYVQLRALVIEYLNLFYAEMILLLEDRFTWYSQPVNHSCIASLQDYWQRSACCCFQLAQGKFSSHGKNIHLYYLPPEFNTQIHLHQDYRSLLCVSSD